jgi:hypothetical protein
MASTSANRTFGLVLALLSCTLAYPAYAADQVLMCQPQSAKGQDVRILISQGMFAKGKILWPSQAGTTIFDIREKTSVSYRAEQSPPADGPRVGGVLYINRLNGELHYSLLVTPKTVDILDSVCKGNLSSDECARRLQSRGEAPPSVCFASIDCNKLGQDGVSGVEASYSCRRSFKKF